VKRRLQQIRWLGGRAQQLRSRYATGPWHDALASVCIHTEQRLSESTSLKPLTDGGGGAGGVAGEADPVLNGWRA
jgi:hypothetical protein